MDYIPTIPTADLLRKACAERCRKGTCDMSCTVAGRRVQWCAEVERAAADGR